MAETAFLIKTMALMGDLEADLFLLKRNSKSPQWDLRNEIMQKSSLQYWCAGTIDAGVFCC